MTNVWIEMLHSFPLKYINKLQHVGLSQFFWLNAQQHYSVIQNYRNKIQFSGTTERVLRHKILHLCVLTVLMRILLKMFKWNTILQLPFCRCYYGCYWLGVKCFCSYLKTQTWHHSILALKNWSYWICIKHISRNYFKIFMSAKDTSLLRNDRVVILCI